MFNGKKNHIKIIDGRKVANYPILMSYEGYFDYPCKIESHNEYVTTHQTSPIPGYGYADEAEFKECKECKDKYEKEHPIYVFDGVTATSKALLRDTK